MSKLILDLCGGTGAWSKPYAEAGYEVVNVTLPNWDVRKVEWTLFHDAHGILAAPPCTMFSLARTRAKTPRDFKAGMEIVKACLNIIWNIREQSNSQLHFWALENPAGYLRQFLGKPAFTFNPCDFGDAYTKKTDLWGYFNLPKKKPIKLTAEQEARCKINNRKLPSISEITSSTQADKRAVTPSGFAKAFFEANP